MFTTRMEKMLGVGKRKKAVAVASVDEGTGRVRINSVPLEKYSPEFYRWRIEEPLMLAGELANSVDIDVNVRGGGISGQTDAVRTAIGNGLFAYSNNDELKKKFMEYDRTLIVSDVRQREPKKPCGKGARSKVQKSYR